MFAVESGKVEMMRFFLDVMGDAKFCEELLAKDIGERPVVMFAARSGKVEIMRFLQDAMGEAKFSEQLLAKDNCGMSVVIVA
ncbi:unnamed protein product, partial [Choristocarpus tenellus]